MSVYKNSSSRLAVNSDARLKAQLGFPELCFFCPCLPKVFTGKVELAPPRQLLEGQTPVLPVISIASPLPHHRQEARSQHDHSQSGQAHHN